MSEEVTVLSNSDTFPKVPRNSDPVDNIPVIHWTQTIKWRTPTFNIKPSSAMLIEGGKRILRQRSIMQCKQCVGVETYWVIYDRSYVVGYMANEVFKPLGELPYNEMQKLFSEAMREIKAQKDNGLIGGQIYKGRSID